ncbi:hypothetical protein [Croceicoccus mobilis]|uniref:hypothetical protein n=1 Tax=Croceicoccus mobilis TaxID=1703339 RepID=UPI0012E9032D|nr:hypothetical protein [Croceicoccus mobilis]
MPDTGKEGPPDAKDAAGHGVKPLDWLALRARLAAERDLRGALIEDNAAMACWMRAEGSFDPRAAEALHGRHGEGHEADARVVPGDAPLAEQETTARLPDPKASRTNDDFGCFAPQGGADEATGTSVED